MTEKDNMTPEQPRASDNDWLDEYFWQEWDKLNEAAMEEGWDRDRKG